MAFGKKTRTGSDVDDDDTVPWVGPTWQYATVSAQTSSETLLDRLNEMGSRGWEAVSHAVPPGAMTTVLLKRPVR